MNIANSDQAEYWSSDAGKLWVAHQQALDTLLQPALEAVLRHGDPQPGEHAVDIGCGTGASSLALSEVVGTGGKVTALDISAPLLERARERAAQAGNITFVLGDAQSDDFARESADLVMSRFGVMFFDDPVAAFANLRRATRPGGRLAMICWAGAPENPWFMVPMKAAMGRLGKPEPMDPHAPGPMAFKDIERVTGILTDAGWSAARGLPVHVNLCPPPTPQEAAAFATTVGPATRVLREKGGTAEDAAAIRSACTTAFASYIEGGQLRIPAALILYSGVNPD